MPERATITTPHQQQHQQQQQLRILKLRIAQHAQEEREALLRAQYYASLKPPDSINGPLQIQIAEEARKNATRLQTEYTLKCRIQRLLEEAHANKASALLLQQTRDELAVLLRDTPDAAMVMDEFREQLFMLDDQTNELARNPEGTGGALIVPLHLPEAPTQAIVTRPLRQPLLEHVG